MFSKQNLSQDGIIKAKSFPTMYMVHFSNNVMNQALKKTSLQGKMKKAHEN